MKLEGYRFVQRLRVAFADVDMLRHANNLAYLRWTEQARTEYLVDVLGETIDSSVSMILATLTITYEVPLQYRERYAIGTKIARFGNKSFDIRHEIWSEDRQLRSASVVSTLVAYDYETTSTIPVPANWRAKVAAFEEPASGLVSGAS